MKHRIMLFCRDFLLRIIGCILAAFFSFCSLLMIWKCSESGNPFTIIFNVLLAAAAATAAALILAQLYLPGIAERIASGLLFPRQYLKKSPPLLSPVEGMIASGRFSEAEKCLTQLRRQYPDNAEIAFLLLNLYEDQLQQHSRALETAETYLESAGTRADEFHFRILMRYADFLQNTPRKKELIEYLEKEIKQKRLTAGEAAFVQTRLAALYRS